MGHVGQKGMVINAGAWISRTEVWGLLGSTDTTFLYRG